MNKKTDRRQLDSYMELITRLPTMAHAIDKDGILINVSDFWLKKMGYEKEEVIGRHSIAFLTEESRQYAEQTALPEYFAKGFIENIPYQMVKKDNAIIDVLLSANSIYDDDGAFICSLATIADITENKRSEELLQKSERRYRNLVSNIPGTAYQFVMSVDGKSRFDYISDNCLDLLGYRAEEIKKDAQLIFDNVPQPDTDQLMQAIERSASTLTRYRLDHRFIKKDGERIWLYTSSIPRKLPDGTIIWDGIGLDITEQKQAENEREINRKILFEAEKLANVGGWEWDVVEDTWTMSENWLRIHGLTKKHLSTSELIVIAHPDDRQKVQEAFERAVEDRISYEIEHRIIRQDTGEERYIKAYGTIKTDQAGKPVKVYGAAHDITDRKHAEIALLESEQKWRNILVHTPQIGFTLDPKGRIVFANRHFLKLTGWEENDVIGQTWFDMFIPEHTREEIREIFHATMLQKNTADFSNYENEILTKSGELITVNWSNLVTKDLHGEVVGVTCLGVDLTERKKYETLLERKNIDLRNAQRIASIGTWILDPEVGVPEWSEEIYRIYERDPNLGPYPLDEYKNIYRGKWWKKFHSVIQAAISDGIPYDIELKLELSSGKEKWIHAICEPEPEIGPKGHKVRGTIQDITEKKQTEEALRQSHKMEAIGTLAGGIAHEFNNMLSIIIGNAELALDDIADSNPAVECVEEIKTAGLRAKDVVRKLLRVARKTTLSRKPLQIGRVVEDSLNLLRRTIPASIDIQRNLICTTELIMSDPTEINQILMNLCTNSAQAMREETGVLEVGLEPVMVSRQDALHYENLRPGNYARLTVKDNGEGIEPGIMDRIFEPYFTTKDVDKGIGMGLAVVLGIIKEHKGAIKIKSEREKGTFVEILLPLIEEQPIPISEQMDMPSRGTERILLVDDEASLAEMVRKILEGFGYEVVCKTSSLEALMLFKENPYRFDLVFSDMTMPEMSGDRLAQEIIQIRPDMKIILFTGHSNRMDERKAKTLGINALVMKPIGKKDLTNVVRNVLDEVKS